MISSFGVSQMPDFVVSQKDYPNAPKRYRTAYILFSVEKRDEIKNENPGLLSKEIIAELGAQWKAADVATKQRFQKLSDTEKVKYEEKNGRLQK
ncbi:unnamed protein product [Rotaria sp. Silwood2]|nr:unnamed protein product [Rotaria sp. Silwood2]